MIVADSSVLISTLRGLDLPSVARLRQAGDTVLVGDIVLLEVLQGAREDRHADFLERNLREYRIVRMLDARLANKAAANFRRLRSKGITIRRTPDLIIGTYCIEHGHQLLQSDRDFLPMAKHLGLRLL